MSYLLKWRIEVSFAADGGGAMGSVPMAQTKIMNNDFNGNGGYILVPGADAPSQANFNTALTTALTNQEAAIAAALAQIQGFATGSG